MDGNSKTKHRSVAAFKITARRSVAISTVNAPTPPANQIAYCDIDNHADTTCCGSNCYPEFFTGEIVDVRPFSDKYQPMMNIPVCRGVTAVDIKTGVFGRETVLLVFNQALWFGDALKHTLVNPNQVRAHGISLCDDPTDPVRSLGVYDGETSISVRLRMDGTTCRLNSRVPTRDELGTCRRIVLTSDAPWDPAAVSFPKISKQDHNVKSIDTGHWEPIDVMSRDIGESGRTAESIKPGEPISDARFCIREIWSLTRSGVFSANVVDTEDLPYVCESDVVMSDISLALSMENLMPRAVNSVFVNYYSPDNDYRDFRLSSFDSNISSHVVNSLDSKYGSLNYTKRRHGMVDKFELAKRWKIGLDVAQKTLDSTTQLNIRHAVKPLTRRYRTDLLDPHMRRLKDTFWTDTIVASKKSLLGNTHAQLFTNRKFTIAYPVPSENRAGVALDTFCHDIGIPAQLQGDGGTNMTGRHTEFQQAVRHWKIKWGHSEAHTQRQNRAELVYREMKKRWLRLMVDKRIPIEFWDFALVWIGETMSRTWDPKLGRTGIEQITGETPDISEWLEFGFYDTVRYWDVGANNKGSPKLGKWLGVAHRVGSALCYYVIGKGGKILARTTVQRVVADEIATDEARQELKELDEAIARRCKSDVLEDAAAATDFLKRGDVMDLDVDFSDEPADDPAIEEQDDYGQYTVDAHDKFVNAELKLPIGDHIVRGTVKRRVIDSNGNPIGVSNPNPILDSREYEVELEDGSIQRYTANIIAENLFAQCDDEGRMHLVFNEIIDHRRDPKTSKTNAEARLSSKRKRGQLRRDVTGWDFLVEWKDGTTDWVKLKDLKQSNCIELAEYCFANKIHEEPGLSWWVKETLRQRDRIIMSLHVKYESLIAANGKNKKYFRTSHKMGIRLPKTVKEALEIDRVTGTDFWRRAIEKEMAAVTPAFSDEKVKGLSPEEVRKGQVLIGYQEIKCHMIFDVKMDMTRKARFVAGGHMTKPPSSITYASVVSRDSVRIAFMLAALNDLDVQAADIGNAYLNAKCKERIWTVGGPEFRSFGLEGKPLVIVRALYGLKSSGAAWRAHLAESLVEMGFTSSRADPDVWMKAARKPDGTKYYEYILVYVDDILVISHDTKPIMERIGELYRLKEGSVGPPTRYLGADVRKVTLDDGSEAWALSPDSYCKVAVDNVERELQERTGHRLKKRADTPLPGGYKPEVDITEELDTELHSLFMQMIGSSRWMCELGRLDILHETSILSSYMASPREGHLEKLYELFAYIKLHPECLLIMDPRNPVVDDRWFNVENDWENFYKDAVDELPPGMPEPRGKAVSMNAFYDASHASNVVTRRSHSGIMIKVMNAPIWWYSKRQNTVESSTFGSEFVAKRIAVDMVESLRYKLRMFGVPLDGPANVFGDNMSVVNASSIGSHVLQKKHNSICYHRVREASAMGMIRCGFIPGNVNPSDMFTKILNKTKRITCLGMMVLGVYYPDRISRAERISRRAKIGTDDRPEIDW